MKLSAAVVKELPKLIERLAEAEVKILLHIYQKGEVKITELPRAVRASFTTVYKALGELKEMKLIYEADVPGNIRLFKLTEHGIYVAKRLKEVDDYLNKILQSP